VGRKYLVRDPTFRTFGAHQASANWRTGFVNVLPNPMLNVE